MLNLRSLSAWRNRYDALSLREQSAIMLGLMAIFSLLVFQLVIFPINDKRDELKTHIRSKEDDLSKLKGMSAQYRRLEAIGDPAKGGKKGESINLFSVLEKLATKNELMDKIDYMKPGTIPLDTLRQENWVEVKLTGITFKQMVDYLYGLQTYGNQIYIKRLSARKDGSYLNLVLQPAMIEMK